MSEINLNKELLKSNDSAIHPKSKKDSDNWIVLVVIVLVLLIPIAFVAIPILSVFNDFSSHIGGNQYTRNTAKMENLKNLRDGLKRFYEDNNFYPTQANPLELGLDNTSMLSSKGFTSNSDAKPPLYIKYGIYYDSIGDSSYYTYVCKESPCKSYSIRFNLEGDAGIDGLEPGIHIATPQGIK